jgi:hypothetical protein
MKHGTGGWLFVAGDLVVIACAADKLSSVGLAFCYFSEGYSTTRTPLHIMSLCGLVARVTDYRSTGPGSIPCATRFSEK